jgi:hypothetical protein
MFQLIIQQNIHVLTGILIIGVSPVRLVRTGHMPTGGTIVLCTNNKLCQNAGGTLVQKCVAASWEIMTCEEDIRRGRVQMSRCKQVCPYTHVVRARLIRAGRAYTHIRKQTARTHIHSTRNTTWG